MKTFLAGWRMVYFTSDVLAAGVAHYRCLPNIVVDITAFQDRWFVNRTCIQTDQRDTPFSFQGGEIYMKNTSGISEVFFPEIFGRPD